MSLILNVPASTESTEHIVGKETATLYTSPSTSAGSQTPPLQEQDYDEIATSPSHPDLGDAAEELLGPNVVDRRIERLGSLEDSFFELRDACLGRPCGAISMPPMLQRFLSGVEGAQLESTTFITVAAFPAMTPLPAVQQARGVRPTSTADSFAGFAVGAYDTPTLGSVRHGYGDCKPCAFFHTKGCGNGMDCKFCHLCPPDEKKQRRKQVAMHQRRGARAM